jgi:hypothetical protein
LKEDIFGKYRGKNVVRRHCKKVSYEHMLVAKILFEYVPGPHYRNGYFVAANSTILFL